MRKIFLTTRDGSTPEQLREMAEKMNFETEILRCDFAELQKKDFPLLVLWKRKYYCVLRKIHRNNVYIADPAKGEYKLGIEAFEKIDGGAALIMKPGANFKKGGRSPSLTSILLKRLQNVRRLLFCLALINILAVALNILMINAVKKILDMPFSSLRQNFVHSLLDNILLFSRTDSFSELYYVIVLFMASLLAA